MHMPRSQYLLAFGTNPQSLRSCSNALLIIHPHNPNANLGSSLKPFSKILGDHHYTFWILIGNWIMKQSKQPIMSFYKLSYKKKFNHLTYRLFHRLGLGCVLRKKIAHCLGNRRVYTLHAMCCRQTKWY